MHPENESKKPNTVLQDVTEKVQSVHLTSASTDNEDDAGEKEDEDDGGGWITPSNIKQIQMDAGEWRLSENVTVGCVTTDFAMQVRKVYVRCCPAA